jgi:uncharacterized circularly permuted ATP-grasp superfamily protein/uncharacterized alpha-E superfamily protein
MSFSLSARYRAAGGRHDAAVDASGAPRPGWERLLDALDRIGPSELDRRQRAADRLMLAEGAGMLLHDGTEEVLRPWRLDAVPLVFGREAWDAIAAGLVERAELLREVIVDLHGPRELLRAGVVPVEALAGHATALRTAWSQTDPPRLLLASADLVTDASGRVCVVRDATDVATGDGHALLARAIVERVLPRDRTRLGVIGHRPYTRALRSALAAAAPSGRVSPRTVVLVGPPDEPGYVEHAYLATQLGYHLAETADVVARRGRAWLRSLEGLEPIDVLLRRVPERALDPVEDDQVSDEGVAGVVEAVRDHGVVLANPHGTGVASHLALLPFLDEASRFLTGRPLALPSLPALWCGDPDQYASVLSSPERYVLHDLEVPGRPVAVVLRGLDDALMGAWLARLRERPERYVARPFVPLGTAPCHFDGSLRPQPVALRTQVLLGADGPVVLPGGHGRVLGAGTTPEASVDAGLVDGPSGVAKDVWVLDPERRARVRVAVPAIPQVDMRRSLPTRAAEAMYWTGRHAERAETAARLVLACLGRTAGVEVSDVDARALASALRLITGAGAGSAGGEVAGGGSGVDLDVEVRAALAGRLASVSGSLRAVVTSARGARQLLSGGTWRLLPMVDEEAATLDRLAKAPDLATFEATEALDGVLVPLAALAGLTAESVVRGPGWRFLDLGRRLERALLVLGLVESMLDPPPPSPGESLRLEVVLAACESLVAYRRLYRSDVRVDAVADMLLDDASNPRSVRFQLEQMAVDLHHLPDRSVRRQQLAAVRAAGHALDAHLPLEDGVAEVVLATRGHLLEVGRLMSSGWFSERLRRVR